LLGNSLPSSQFQRLAVEQCSMPGVCFSASFPFFKGIEISPSQSAPIRLATSSEGKSAVNEIMNWLIFNFCFGDLPGVADVEFGGNRSLPANRKIGLGF
jgi:hypothetical protein